MPVVGDQAFDVGEVFGDGAASGFSVIITQPSHSSQRICGRR